MTGRGAEPAAPSLPSRRICLWSGPRNVSTALMYAFAQRPDTRVLDEPLYAHYLRASGAEHPGAAEVLAAMDPDGPRVLREVVLGPCDRPVLFMKHMAHHLVGLDLGFLARVRGVLLVRDPAEVLPSLARQIPMPTLRDTGLAVQADLLRRARAAGRDLPVLDARLLLRDPRGVLSALCARLEIPFDEAMLSWPAGPRPEDGVWAPHWYHNVHRSTGFRPYRPTREPLPSRLAPLLAECRPYYRAIAAEAIGAETRVPPEVTAP